MAGLVCPHCGATTAFTPIQVTGKGILWDYSRASQTTYGNVSIMAVVEPDDRAPHFAIIVCQAQDCGRLFAAAKEHGSYGAWQAVWPLPDTAVPRDIPDPVRSAFGEAVLCLAVEAHGGCLLMCRTTLIRIQRERKVAGLQELEDQGSISRSLREQADEVRLWANVVGHEDFREEDLTHQACEELVEYMRSLLDALYVHPARLARHQEQRKQVKKG